MSHIFKRFVVLLAASVLFCSNTAGKQNRAEVIAARMQDPKTRYVVVVSHRGDWRNYPENSIPAIESVIRMGVDVMELDLKMTKDSVLVLSHDETLDRCTTGTGLISDYTYRELLQFTLRRAHGIATDSLRICTLKEALACCKDRICVNIDQGYEYYDQALEIAEELGVTSQLLIKGKKPVADVAAKMAAHPNNMMYMPIIDIQKEKGVRLFDEYQKSGTVPIAYEVCWKKMDADVRSCIDTILASGSKLWVNTIWGSLCGYLDDDKALSCGNPAEVYDQVLSLGASIIQTDRPEQLIRYLRKKGRHE